MERWSILLRSNICKAYTEKVSFFDFESKIKYLDFQEATQPMNEAYLKYYKDFSNANSHFKNGFDSISLYEEKGKTPALLKYTQAIKAFEQNLLASKPECKTIALLPLKDIQLLQFHRDGILCQDPLRLIKLRHEITSKILDLLVRTWAWENRKDSLDGWQKYYELISLPYFDFDSFRLFDPLRHLRRLGCPHWFTTNSLYEQAKPKDATLSIHSCLKHLQSSRMRTQTMENSRTFLRRQTRTRLLPSRRTILTQHSIV